MAIEIVDLLELVEVDVDQPEDAGILACLFNNGVQMLVQREAIVNVGEQIELRTVQQIGVEAAGFDGQRGQPRTDKESFVFRGSLGLFPERRRQR